MRESTEDGEGRDGEKERKSVGHRVEDHLIPLRGRTLACRRPLQHQERQSFLDLSPEP